MKIDLFQRTTDKIVELMLANGPDWKRPWLGDGLAKNIVTGNSYRGSNIPILGSAGFQSHEWGSYKQWQDVGAQVRAGERSTLIFLWKTWHTKDKQTDKDRAIKLVRAFPVFNREQVDNPPPEKKDTRTPIERHAEFERVVAATGADIRYGGDRAAFFPSQDRIIMPKLEQFKTTEGYAGTLSHELGHWTGAKNRLDRDLSGRFGDKAYALEELIAEISSALTCVSVGVIPEPRDLP